MDAGRAAEDEEGTVVAEDEDTIDFQMVYGKRVGEGSQFSGSFADIAVGGIEEDDVGGFAADSRAVEQWSSRRSGKPSEDVLFHDRC